MTFRDHELILEQQRFKWLRNVLVSDGGLPYKSWSAMKRNCLFATSLASLRGPFGMFELSDRSMRILVLLYNARPSKKLNKFARHDCVYIA